MSKHDASNPVPEGGEEEKFEQYELAMRLVRAVAQAEIRQVLQANREVDGDLHLQRDDEDPILP